MVAKTLNQFGLEASESTRVADVMAKSFVSSALDIEVFAEGMKNAGVASKAVGVDIEQTTAILSVLANNGIDASTAGTQLKNVFIELSDQGLTWEEAMTKINKSQNKLQTANDLFGKRAAIVSTVIAENGDIIDELSKSYQDATGSAKAMADIVGNNLQGDMDRLSSSWEGLIARGSGLNTAFRVITTTVTFLIDAVKQLGTDVLSLFSVSGLIDLAVKKFGVRIQIFFNDLIIDSFKALQKGAAKLGLSIDSINDTITSNQQLNANLRAKIAEEEAEKGESAFERYRKSLTAIFNESEDAQTAAKIKGSSDRNKITNLETEDDTDKIKKETEKRIAYQKQKTFELELFRKTRDANEETDLDAKFEKLKEVERFKRDFLLENTKLIETDREIIIEESAQKEIELDAQKNEEKRKNAEKLAKDQKKIDDDKNKNDEASAKKSASLDRQVAQQKVGLLNAGFNLAKTIAGKNEKLQRAIAIGQAISNTALGITKAFATLPFPAAVPAALSIGATGAAQLLTIKNSDSGTGSIGGIDTGGGTTPTNEVTADTSGADAAAGATAALENAIANLGLTVSVTEINDAQNNVSLSETNSQI